MIPLRDRVPTQREPLVTYGLLALNAFAFLWQVALDSAEQVALVSSWGFVPSRFLAEPLRELPTVFSSVFLHVRLLHLLGNMLFLWVFGDNVEDALGRVRYVLFYLGGGLTAAIAQAIVDSSSTLPMVGASGAIAAIIAGYVTLYPRSRVLVLVPTLVVFFFFEFSAWLVVLEWVVLNVLQANGTFGGLLGDGVAWFAHVGGFPAGLLLVRVGMIGRPRIPYEPWHGFRVEKRLRRKQRVTYRRPWNR